MGSLDSGNVWIENSDGSAESVVSIIYLFPSKTSMALRSTLLAAYPVQQILLNVSSRRGQQLIGNDHTLVGFLQVYCTQEELEEEECAKDEDILEYGFTSSMKVPLESGIRDTADLVQR